ncbi:hypothetical protein [Aquimarina aggregata]|uniref:hypothetical protein n=1 Tax=Aquimarina aggregata TaxID=1642818 RepID=UPI0024923E38|nr:hypothetical protein [Aquimarina aggregata]
MTPEQKQIRAKEAKIGRHAARLTEQYLHSNINRLFDVKNKGGVFQGREVEPMLRATRVRSKIGDFLLLGLDATSNKYAFIHHYGFSGKRDGGTVYLDHQRFSKDITQRNTHVLNVNQKSIFHDIYKSSGALDYLVTELTKTRTESFNEKFKDVIDNISKDEQ